MIDHASIKIAPAFFDEIVHFYERALEPLGYKKMREIPNTACGFGDTTPDFWIFANGKDGDSAHIALRAKDRETVKKFYDAAMRAGAKDNGEPGIREQIHPTYYTAFVHDLAGNNVEAVCHNPE